MNGTAALRLATNVLHNGVKRTPIVVVAGFDVALGLLVSLAGLGCCVLVVLLQPALGHGLRSECVQHAIVTYVGARYVDIEIELTFRGVYAQREVERMDADQNGIITEPERRLYLANVAPRAESALHLTCDRKPVRILPLYSPEIEVTRSDPSAGSILRLYFFYFARTPEWLAPGSILRIEDRLWRDSPALCSMDVQGENAEVFVIGAKRIICNPGAARAFQFLCKNVPAERHS